MLENKVAVCGLDDLHNPWPSAITE